MNKLSLIKGAICVFALLFASVTKAQDNSVRNGGEYYLYNTYYSRCLGGNEAQNGPALSVPGEDMSGYVWVAEASDLHEGWYWLRHKTTGKYLQASNKEGDTWSCWFAGSLNKAYNSYEWEIGAGIRGYIKSNRGNAIHGSEKCFLGVDKGKEKDAYIGVYYDKGWADISAWQIVDASYPLNEGRLKLYTEPLDEAITQGESIYNNSLYGKPEELAVALYNARSAKETASLDNIETIQTATTALKAAITNAQEGKYDILISGSSFNAEDAFTVSFGHMTFNSNDEVEFIIRNSRKTGAVIYISPSHVRIGDTTIKNTSPGSYDVLMFSFDGKNINVIIDDKVVGTVPQSTVPAQTSVGTSAELTVIGESIINKYRLSILSLDKDMEHITPNKFGKYDIYTIRIKGNPYNSIGGNIDNHILATNNALGTTTLNIEDDNTWVIFDNIRPSDVISKYLNSITIKGEKAINGKNCRVAIYLHGAVVYPYSPDETALYGYSGELYSGTEYKFKEGKNDNMGEAANELKSFILKRGYMVCFSTNSDGSGYSRVYVADHEDKRIDVLPNLLKDRISRAYIRKWNWVSKKGWCSTESTSAIEAEGEELGCTWYYSWSADRQTLTDMEYVPHKNHIYWPSWSSCDKSNATAVLGYNEPDHSEQHSDDCGKTIDPWKACTHQPEFMACGLRVGSPCPTDASWLTQFIKHCDDMAYRCDFVTFHAYWGTNEAANSDSWWWQLEQIYKNTGRPIWLTEWNNGASWTSESWPSSYSDKLAKQKNAIKYILSVLDNADFIERYSLYNWDSYYRAAISWDSNKNSWWVTPCGEVYRDTHPSHAYKESKQKEPVGWWPSTKTDNSFSFTVKTAGRQFLPVITNKNADYTATETIEYKDPATGEWLLFYDNSKGRSKFDSTAERATTVKLDSCNYHALTSENLTLRLHITTLGGGDTATEPVTVTLPAYITQHYGNAVGISDNIANKKSGVSYYSIDGRISNTNTHRTVNVMRDEGGKTVKVIRK